MKTNSIGLNDKLQALTWEKVDLLDQLDRDSSRYELNRRCRNMLRQRAIVVIAQINRLSRESQ